MLGDYEVVTKLRSGGMADLYLAKREGPGGFARHVAIKVVHPRLARDRAFVDMFLDEARLAASISHPNVVHIEDLGQEGGTYFLVMEYLHGATLAQVLMHLYGFGRRFSPTTAASLVADAAAGLHAAHQARGPDGKLLNVVHRDISPQNLFLTNEGELKVIDFGIAKASGRLHKTQGNAVKGKMAYMPPEQFLGTGIDHRADLYALGIVLWEMLTLERLFPAKDDFSLIQMVRAGPRCPPSALVPGISPALDAVVMATLSADPDARPATGRELRNRLLEAEPEARHVERIDLAGLLFALMPDELAAQAMAMGRPSLAGPVIDTFEMEATPLQCLDRLSVPHGQGFDEDEATVVDGAILDELVAGATSSNSAGAPNLSQDLFGDKTRPLGSSPAPASSTRPLASQPSEPVDSSDFARTAPIGRTTEPLGMSPPPSREPERPTPQPEPALRSNRSGDFAVPPPTGASLLRPILLGLGIGAAISAIAVYILIY